MIKISDINESAVIVRRCRTYSNAYSCLKGIIHNFWNQLNIDKLIKSNKIIIKINLCDARSPETGAITHPLFLDSFLRILRDLIMFDGEILVVESDASVAQPDLFIKWFGFEEILNKWNVKYVNLSRMKVIKKIVDGYLIPIPKLLDNKDYFFITMPKLKTCVLTYLTCCLKNQYGCISMVRKYKYHPAINQVISIINKLITPDLCVVDGIISMLGTRGPAYGRPEKTGLVIVGNDPVATDSYAAKLLGLNPWKVPHIVESFRRGVGSMVYSLFGDDLTSEFPKMKFIEIVELHFLKFTTSLEENLREGGKHILKN